MSHLFHCGTVLRVLGQAHPPLARLLGVFAAAFLIMVPLALGAPTPSQKEAALRAKNQHLESQKRSVVLSLYSLDSRLVAAHTRLVGLRAQTRRLRAQQATLRKELSVARVGAQISEDELATQIRRLYEQGAVSPLEAMLGAQSLDDALTALDNIKRVASLNNDVLLELRSAQTRISATSRALKEKAAKLETATAAAAAAEASLAQTRAARSSFISSLSAKQAMNSADIARIEAQAKAAQALSVQLTGAVPAATVATIGSGSPIAGGHTLTVSITGYALPGYTASGLPVGWGIVAVDPRVIPLGTHMFIPGYGDAVAADVGSAILGNKIDLWFPTIDQARFWGRQTVTITLR